MSEFEFLFVLFSLVMGLSLVELLTGLGRALEVKLHQGRAGAGLSFGWLTPLLAVFVILDLLSFWMFAWVVRDLVTVTRISMLGVVGFCSAYFLAARLVFPSDPEAFRDLDSHYWQVRRTILAMLMAIVALQWAFLMAHPALLPMASKPISLGMTAVLLGLMAAAMLTANRRWAAAILAALVARYLLIYVI